MRTLRNCGLLLLVSLALLTQEREAVGFKLDAWCDELSVCEQPECDCQGCGAGCCDVECDFGFYTCEEEFPGFCSFFYDSCLEFCYEHAYGIDYFYCTDQYQDCNGYCGCVLGPR
jgi:hypothetical protein